jgi:hypothetical protein
MLVSTAANTAVSSMLHEMIRGLSKTMTVPITSLPDSVLSIL